MILLPHFSLTFHSKFHVHIHFCLSLSHEGMIQSKTCIQSQQKMNLSCVLTWPEVISNEELWRRTEETEISIQTKRRKWNWIGHTLRKGNEAIEWEVLDWNPQGKRKRGRPKQTWRRSVHNEALEEGKSRDEVKKLARNRIRWRRFVDPQCP